MILFEDIVASFYNANYDQGEHDNVNYTGKGITKTVEAIKNETTFTHITFLKNRITWLQ